MQIPLYGLLLLVGFFIAVRVIRRFWKFPAPSYVGHFLDSGFRKFMQPPAKIIERSGIKKNMIVMDLGCGQGTYTIDVARTIGKKGKVYAVDIQQAMINKLEKKLGKTEYKDIQNIILKVADAYELPLPENSLDLVYIVAVLQEIPDEKRALKEIYRVLKYDGILAVSEFFPDPDFPLRRTTKKI
ncbi:class I SAM-dependent methyltransferase [[Eubacterium] cellulosolvens]